MRKRRVLLTCCVGAIAVAVGLAARDGTSSRRPRSATGLAAVVSEAGGLPRPQQPAFEVGRPTLLRRDETRAVSAPVERTVEARVAPSPKATSVGTVEARTPDDTTNIVAVLGQVTRSGASWVRIRLSSLPNDRTGWVPRETLGGYRFVHTQLIVDRKQLTATLLDDGRRVFQAPVGIGRTEWPTPRGAFIVVDVLTRFTDPMYGPIAFGTSAKSQVLTDWPGGGVVGIHGTDEPALIPGRISHGCIRLRNDDILRLARLMPVGTPVDIE